MNKLDVALKLLRLLNERKTLDSRTVANELNVSLRTAQRYLLDLSSLPCVITYEKEHTYSLATDYQIKDALCKTEYPFQKPHQDAIEIHKAICAVCGGGRNFLDLPFVPVNSSIPRSNRQKIEQLIFLVGRKLKEGKR